MKTGHMLVIFISLHFSIAIKPAEEVSTILHSKLAKYNKNIRPNYGYEPVSVGISADISVVDVSDKKMEFTVYMELKQTWIDPRLAFEDAEVVKEIGIGAEFAQNFWVPDTFFANAKLSNVASHKTDSDMFLKIQSSGKITLVRRMTVTASCSMDLHLFPLDSQVCMLEIQSFGHSVDDIELGWRNGNQSVQMVNPNNSSHMFKVSGIILKDKKSFQMTGIYQPLYVEIKMNRTWLSFVKSFYIPVGSSVILSWLAFFIPPWNVTARVILGLGMLLSVVMLQTQNLGMTASVSYMTAADMFSGGCCILIIMSLIVSTGVSCADNRDKKSNKLQHEERKLKRVLRCLQGRWIDIVSCVLIPALTLGFAIKYWEHFGIQNLIDKGL